MEDIIQLMKYRDGINVRKSKLEEHQVRMEVRQRAMKKAEDEEQREFNRRKRGNFRARR